MENSRWEADMKLINNGGSLVAVGKVTLDRVIVIQQVKIIQGENGLFVSLPRQSVHRKEKAEWHNILTILTEQAREEMERAVMESMKKELLRNTAPVSKLQVKITEIPTESCLKAFVTVHYDNILTIQGIRIMESNGKRWVSMPKQKNGAGYQDLLFLSTSLSRQNFDSQILNMYERQREQQRKKYGQ